jgi:flagellar hook-associated protein 2
MSTPVSGSGSSTSSSGSTTSSQQLAQQEIQALLQQSNQPAVSFGGLVSGINTQQIVQALLAADQAPLIQIQAQQAQQQAKLVAWQDVNSKLQAVQAAADTLGLQATVSARQVTFAGANGTFATAVASPSAANGSFQLEIDQLATATRVQSTSGVGGSITGTDLATGSSKLATPVSTGSFTVDGQTITVTAGEDFNSILADISTQTHGVVTGSIVNNRVQLTSASTINLGSGGDTSNFLSVVKLLGQPAATTMSSAGPVGVVNPTVALDQSNISGLQTGVTTGSLTINGVTITYNSTSDSLSTILGKINASAAGVTAAYDAASDTVTFTSSKTGNIDVSMADGGGNLLSSLKLVAQAQSTTNIGQAITGADDATSSSKLPAAVTAGTFTVDGFQVTVSAGETFGAILTDIGTQTGGAVTGAIVGDTIQLTSNNGQQIALGNGGDTSNFLTVARLSGTGFTVTSSGPVGEANATATLDNASLNGLTSTTTGAMVINGVTINYDTTVDSLNAVINRINNSGAGVAAAYDSSTDKVTLTSTNGSGVTISDTSGNLASTLALPASVSGAHQLGQSAKYEVNGGPAQYSLTNTVNNLVPGVNVTFQAATPVGSPLTGTITLNSSVGAKAMQDFVTAYNALADLIQKDTAFDANTKIAGIFLGDPTISNIQQSLDSGLFISNGTKLGLTPPFIDVSTIGLNTGPIGSAPGTTIDVQFDTTTFDSALATNPQAVTNLVNTVFHNLSQQVLNIVQPFGLVDSAIQSENSEIRDLQTQIDAQQHFLQQQQDFLNSEFTNLDSELAQLQSQSSAGAAVLSSLASQSQPAQSSSSSSTGTTGA